MDITTIEELIASVDSITLDLSIPDYPIFIVKNKNCEAKVALHGAHLFQWNPTDHNPVIYNSPTAIYCEGKAIRGGVPVCWPWFNAHPTDDTLPSHGIARNRFWELCSIDETLESTTLRFTLHSTDETREVWDSEFHAAMDITLGKKVTLSLTSINPSEENITFGGALHTYLEIGDISETTVTGLDQKAYLDTVGENTERTQDGAISFNSEVDRIYQDTIAPIVVNDGKQKREITIERTGSKSAVVWNPWIEKAISLGDLPDEAYKEFLCVEAANALSDVYIVTPGKSHSLSTTISVEHTS